MDRPGHRLSRVPGGPRKILAALLVACWLGGLSLGWAQVAPSVGGNAIDASILQQKPEKDLRQPGATDQPLKPQAENKSNLDTTDAAGTETAAPQEEGPRFRLQEIQITGVTVFPSATLEEKFIPWIDREVGYTELMQIAGDITKLYRENGYITSRAVIPPQEIDSGIVTIQVVEGRIGEVQIEGNRHVRDGYIQARLHQKPGEVFRLQALQKDMVNLSNDSVFDQVHATLKNGSKPGTSDLLVDIDDHNPLHFMIGVDNMGRNGIGLWRNSYTLSHENLLGFGDSGAVNVVLASNTLAGAAQYRFPLTTNGVAVGGAYSFTHVNAGETQTPVLIGTRSDIRTITGNSHRLTSFLDLPIYRSPTSRRWNVGGNVSLNVIESMTYLDGESLKDISYALKKRNPANKIDKFPSLRTITSRVSVTEQDRSGRWLLNGSMTNGIAEFGGNDTYTKFNSELTRVQELPYGLLGLLRAEGQFSPSRLPFAEKMQLGGAGSVRGYSEGYLIADAGYLLSAELRYPLMFLPGKIRGDWQGLVFVEHGRLFATGNNDVANTFGRPGSLLGYGIGFRGRLTKYANARLDLGFATNRADKQPDLRAHFSINSPLF